MNTKIDMEQKHSSIVELVKKCPDLTVSIKAGELLEMVNYCILETRRELEQQITDANTETYPSRKKVAEIFDINLSTLWHWQKRGYLVPIEIGGKRRYRMSDVKRILKIKDVQASLPNE